MDTQSLPLFAAVVSLVTGILLCWLYMRGRIASAVTQGKTEFQIEFALAKERVRALEEDRQLAVANQEELKMQAAQWREALDLARDERAQLTERASRVSTLEAEVLVMQGQEKTSQQEFFLMSTDDAEKTQLLKSVSARLVEVESENATLQRNHTATSSALQDSNERRATLEAKVTRLPILEAEVLALQNQEKTNQQEFLLLSTTEAEKTQSLKSVSARLAVVEAANVDLQRSLTSTSSTLQGSNELRATLEAEVSRLPALEEKLSQAERTLQATQQQAADLREASGRLNAELKAEREALSGLREEFQIERTNREAAHGQVSKLTTELAEMGIRLTAEQEQSEGKLTLLLQAKEAMTDQFKNLANEILEEKSKRFSEQNQSSLGLLLDPLKLKIAEFQIKVEDVYVKEGKDRTALAEQVRQLMDLNQVLSQDAKNLTTALKGSSKTQGNWGELILERVLEASGLRKGEEYDVQESHTRADGSRAQPDVVIHLPEDRHLVVDAKVSLTAYENLSTSDDDAQRQVFTKRHLESIRTHMRGLSEKNYQTLYGLKSLDFVLMFVPIEPAFMLAVSQDSELFMDAWQKNVLLVSPSTLLFVVRTVAHLWRQEAQTRNAQDIAKRGAELYDKLVGFVEDLESLGTRLKQAQKEYDSAHNKLTGGRGNVIRQAEMLKDLGVKPSKTLPPAIVEIAMDSAILLPID